MTAIRSMTLTYRLPQYMAICFGGKTAEEAVEIEAE
jgi:sulfopyruvate decarboxylase TPP-binding subunit